MSTIIQRIIQVCSDILKPNMIHACQKHLKCSALKFKGQAKTGLAENQRNKLNN